MTTASTQVIDNVFEEVKQTRKLRRPHLYRNMWAYPALRVWQKRLGVPDARIDTLIIYARKSHAPKWAFARKGDKWLDLGNDFSFEIESYFKAYHAELFSMARFQASSRA